MVFHRLPPSFRVKQENLEPKETEVFKVSVDWRGRKEHRVTEVRSQFNISIIHPSSTSQSLNRVEGVEPVSADTG